MNSNDPISDSDNQDNTSREILIRIKETSTPIKVAVIGVIGLVIATVIGAILNSILKTPKPEPITTTISSFEQYDDFNNGCIDTRYWGEIAVSHNDDLKFTKSSGEPCWSLFTVDEIVEQSGQLKINLSNTDDNKDYVISLFTEPGRPFYAVGLDVEIEEFRGEVGGIGIFSRSAIDPQPWNYTYLHIGGDLPQGQSDIVYFEQNIPGGRSSDRFTLGERVSLSVQWDGNQLQVFVNNQPAFSPVDFDGLSDMFGIYIMVGPKSTITANVDNYRVIWK